MNKEVLLQAGRAVKNGIPCALAVIIFTMGSSPGKKGDAMLVTEEQQFGTIGGGAVEFECSKLCREAIRDRKTWIRTFDLNSEKAGELGMVCGGKDTVLFQYLDPSDPEVQTCFQELDRLAESDSSFWLLFTNSQAHPHRIGVFTGDQAQKNGGPGDDSRRVVYDFDGDDYVISVPVRGRERVIVYGGGHVSQQLVPLLEHLSFACTVVDDSGQFANRDHFPDADRIEVMDFNGAADHLGIGRDDYVVIMTRGHKSDYTAEKETLSRNPRYIGVIGSRKKTQHLNEQLEEDGFTKEELDSVFTPIGLNIGAKTPAEIAVSIAAELIRERAKDNAGCCGGKDWKV